MCTPRVTPLYRIREQAVKSRPGKQDTPDTDAMNGAQRAATLRALRAKRDDLVQRAGVMGRMGYLSSCFDLQHRAARVEDQIFSVEFGL